MGSTRLAPVLVALPAAELAAHVEPVAQASAARSSAGEVRCTTRTCQQEEKAACCSAQPGRLHLGTGRCGRGAADVLGGGKGGGGAAAQAQVSTQQLLEPGRLPVLTLPGSRHRTSVQALQGLCTGQLSALSSSAAQPGGQAPCLAHYICRRRRWEGELRPARSLCSGWSCNKLPQLQAGSHRPGWV